MFDEAETEVIRLVVDKKLEVRKVFPVEAFALSDLSNFGDLIKSSTRRHRYLAKYCLILRENKITSDQGLDDSSDNGLGKRAPI